MENNNTNIQNDYTQPIVNGFMAIITSLILACIFGLNTLHEQSIRQSEQLKGITLIVSDLGNRVEKIENNECIMSVKLLRNDMENLKEQHHNPKAK